MAEVLARINDPSVRMHFEISDKPGKVKCVYCKKDILFNATRLKRHLARMTGKDVAVCNSNPDEVMEEFKVRLRKHAVDKEKKRVADEIVHNRTSNLLGGDERLATEAASLPRTRRSIFESVDLSGRASTGSGSAMGSTGADSMLGTGSLAPPRTRPGCQPSLPSFDEVKNARARMAVAQLLYVNNLPLHMVDHPLTQQLVDTILEAGPGFKVPSYRDVRTTLLEECKSNITTSLGGHRKAWDRSGCSLMCDGWTDKRGRSILNFMVASREGTMFLKSIDSSSETKTGAYLQRVLGDTIREIGPEKVVQVLSDNAANFINAGDLLMVEFPHLVHTPCAAHCVDLMLEDIGKISWVHNVIKIAKRMTKFLYAHTVIHDYMVSITKKEILRPGTTRFATNFILLKSLYDVRDGLGQMFTSAQWRSNRKFAKYRSSRQCADTRRQSLDDGYWERVDVVVKIVAPIVTVLRMVDGEGQPMGELYHSMQVCKEEIKNILDLAGESDKYPVISGIFDARWKVNMYRDIHAAAHALNPKYGFGNDFFTDAASMDIARRLNQYVMRAYDDMALVLELQNELALYKEGRCPSGNPAVSMGVRSMDAYNWWMVNAPEFPRLAMLALRVLMQPCSSSGCERNWSVFEQIHTKRRNRLASKRLSDLVYVHYNLKLQYKNLMKPMSSFATVDDMDMSTPASRWLPRGARDGAEPPTEAEAEGSLALATCASSSRAGQQSSDEDDDEYDPSSDEDSQDDDDDDDGDGAGDGDDVDMDAPDTRTPMVTYARQKLAVRPQKKARGDVGTSSRR